MAAEPTRKILSCHLATGVLHHILYNEARPAILLVCSTRDHFLAQLQAAIRTQSTEPKPGSHRLLTKTIGILSKSSKVRLVFCPTLEHLRAYVSVLEVGSKMENEIQSKRLLLAVFDLLALHVASAEFSAQGLSRTLASVVEVAAREGADLMLCECQDPSEQSKESLSLWDEHVPILNGSVRMGGEEHAWRGRGVSVKRVAERWFEFNDDSRITTATVED